MRSLHKLYKVAVDYSKALDSGLCTFFCVLREKDLISDEEFDKLREHFHKNKPCRVFNSQFIKHHSYTGSGWWWLVNREGRQQRILFLKYLEQKTKPWYLKLWWF